MTSTNLIVYFLENKDWDNKVIPSSTIYFGKYPYRLTFNRTLNVWQDYIDMHVEFSAFIEDNGVGNFRRLFNKNTQRLYISSFEDLTLIYNLYCDQITEVNGPVSDAHCQILQDSAQRYEHKPNGWYRKFDTRYEIIPNWGIPFTERKNMVMEIRESLKQMVSNLKISNEHTVRYNCVCYLNYDEMLEALPFIKLSYPNVRMYITRSTLPD